MASDRYVFDALVWTTNVQEITSIWKYGFVWTGKPDIMGKLHQYVNAKTINYITKYVTKIDFKHRNYKPVILTSPGIGNGYKRSYDSKQNAFRGNNTIETYRTPTGHKIMLPIYWRNKIYTEQERELLWLQKLDKEERWVMGERISIRNNNYNEYNRTLKYYQKKNKALGYDSNEIKWEVKEYEQQRRKLNNEKRMQNARTKRAREEA